LKIGRISVRRLLEEKKSRSELAYAGLPKGHDVTGNPSIMVIA
jgi:hypothetical protein